ncbi:hypothetical protein ACQY0O_002186 [Thecaphora frezii]
MSSSQPVLPSIVRPGQAPEGPPGWEAQRIQREEEARQGGEAATGGGLQNLKHKVHQLGEKMHLVEPKDPEQRTAAQQQNASTGPEIAPRGS